MSEFNQSSYYAQQADFQNGDNYDDILGVDTFEVNDFNNEFGDYQFLEYPDVLPNYPNIVSTEQPSNQGQPQESLRNLQVQSRVDVNEFVEDGEELSYLQDTMPGHDSFGDGQQEDGLTSGQQQFQFEFNAEDWKSIENQIADEQYSEVPDIDAHEDQRILKRLEKAKQTGTSTHKSRQYGHKHVGPVHYKPYAHGDVDSPSNLTQPFMDSRQWSAVNTPAMDSGYGTAGMSREATHGPNTAAPNQTGSGLEIPSLDNTQGALATTYPTARSPTGGEHAAQDDAEDDNSDEEYEEEDVPNEVAFETYEEHDPFIVQDPPQRMRGRTGTRNGHQVWFNPQTSQWQPSASHHDMRGTLIARAQAEYPNDRYLYPDETDGLPHGETAFFKPHQYRGPDRNDCADELFAWRDYKPKKDEDGNPKKKEKPKYTRKHPGYMFEGDRVLLDPYDNPVVNHKFIPLTLSSMTDGSKLQEMVLHPDCQQVDLWARMPRWEQRKDKNGNLVIRELRSKNTRINMPMTRFREKKGTIAGGIRECSDVVRAGLLNFYHSHGFDPVASGNSTRGFPRDLAPWEVKEVRLGNAGKFGKRAGGRALSDNKRKDNLQKTVDSIEKGRKKQAAKDGDAGKRSLQNEGADSQDFNTGPTKRRRRGQEADAGFTPWDEQYTGQYGGSTFEDGQNGYGIQGNLHRRQQDGTFQASLPPQENLNAYGAPEVPYQYQGIQAQPLPVQSQFNSSQNFSNIGTSFTPAQSELHEAPYGGVQMQPTRSPYGNNYYSGAHEYENQGTIRKAFPAGPRQKKQTPPGQVSLNNSASNQNRNHYVSPVQRQRPYEGMGGAPKPNGNTLGPDGRKVYQAPKQVLGKRGQTKAGEAKDYGNRGTEETTAAGRPVPIAQNHTPNETQQDQANVQNPDPDADSSHKRRRNNAIPGTEPKPQRRRQNGRNPRPRHYGAGGAPEPLMPPDEFFPNVQPSFDVNGDTAGPLKSPEELEKLFGFTQPSSGFDGDAEGTLMPPEEFEEFFGTTQPTSGFNGDVEGTLMPPDELFETAPYDFDFNGNLGVQGFDDFEQNGWTANAEPHGRVSEGQLHVNETIPRNSHQAPQVEDAHLTPPQHIYINGTIINVGEAPQVADAQGPDPPQAPKPAQTDHEAPSDIRDVRPADGWQSQSLHDALRYTREAYLEWTGNEAPVTNLEDSYNVQYRELRADFRTWWRSEENPQRSEPLPELWRMKAWSGSIEDWKAPVNVEHLYEPMRRGRWAPRNEDGSLKQPEFQWDYREHGWYDAKAEEQL